MERRGARHRGRRNNSQSPSLYPDSHDENESGNVGDANPLTWSSINIGQERLQQKVTEGNMFNVVKEMRAMIDRMFFNSVRAVNIAGVIAGLFILMIVAAIALNIVWYMWQVQTRNLTKENKQDIKDLSDDVNAVVTNLTGVNHSILSNLGSDDHTQYALVTGRPTTEFTTHAADATIHFTESTIDLTSLGSGEAITPGDRNLKSLVEGSGVMITSTATELTISANATSISGNLSLNSVGTGISIVPGGLDVNSFIGGDGINVSSVSNTVFINSTASLNSVGTGVGLNAGDLDAKSLTSNDNSIEYSSTSTEVDLSVNTTFLKEDMSLFLNNLGTGTVLSPNEDNFDIRSLTSSTLDITNTSTEVNLEVNVTDIASQIELNDISTGESLKGSGGLDLKGITPGGGGEITIFCTSTDCVIDVDTNELDLNSVGSGVSLAPGGLDMKSLLAGAGIDITSTATEVTVETDIDVVYANYTTDTVVLTENLLTANTSTGVITTAGGSVTLETVTSDCPGVDDVAVGCNCDRELNSGDPALIMTKTATIFRNDSNGDEQCICEWEVAHADGANYTFFAQAVCLRFTV